MSINPLHENSTRKRVIPKLVFLWLLLGSAGVVGIYINDSRQCNDWKGLRVVVTTGMLRDIVKNILDNDDVHVIIRPSLDPHSYKTTLEDVSKLEQADLIFANGLHLEGPLAKNLKSLQKKAGEDNENVFFASDFLSPEDILNNEKGADGRGDPHIWFSIRRWIQVTEGIGAILQKRESNPAKQRKYKERTKAYIKQLEELDRYVKQKIEEIPREKRLICMPHNAFAYFADDYKCKVIAPQGLSTVEEPSLKSKNDIVDEIIRKGIKVIFLETSTNNSVMKAIQETCAQHGHTVTVRTLYTDSLATDGDASNYLGMIKQNVDTMIESFKSTTT